LLCKEIRQYAIVIKSRDWHESC